MNRLKLFIVIATLIAIDVCATERTPVRVTFGIKPHHQYDVFDPAEAAAINGAVLKALRDELQPSFPAFDFSPAQPASHIHVSIEDDQLGAAGSVKIRIAVDPDRFPDRKSLWIDLRSAGERGNPTGTPIAFAAEVGGRLRRLIRDQRQDFVEQVLRYVPVAKRAFCIAPQKMFILPFTAAEMAIGDDTRFEIHARDADSIEWNFDARPAGVAPAAPNIPSEYQSKMRARATGPPESLQILGTATLLQPVAVFVTIYAREIVVQPVPPSDFVPSGGSQ